MTDIDQVLRLDAEQWNRAQPSPPDFDDALTAITAPRRLSALSGRRRMTGAVGATVVVAASVITAVVVGAHRHVGSAGHPDAGQSLTAATSIVVGGRTIPYAGGVPWAGAVIPDAHSSSIDVFADGDSMITHKDVCGLPAERAYVRESPTTVTILVAGYETPQKGDACAGVGHGPQIQRLTLTAPLGRRTLIDATGRKVHPVLDASSVPAPPVPSRFRADPITWDEKTGLVTRTYRVKMTELIELRFGPISTIDSAGDGNGSPLKSVMIGASPAEVLRYTDTLNDATTVVWSVGVHRLALSVWGYPKQHFSVAAVVQMARSVR